VTRRVLCICWATHVLQTHLEPEFPSDEALAARAARGSHAAFVSLVARHQRRVYRLAMRMCRHAADAEDVAQDTFAHAYRAIASFRGESKVTTWLYRIVLNETLMRRRTEKRRPSESFDALVKSELDPSAIQAGSDERMSADELIDRKALTLRVMAALSSLDQHHRAALVLRDLEELSAEESAKILGVGADVVRQRAHRARRMLREQLGPR